MREGTALRLVLAVLGIGAGLGLVGIAGVLGHAIRNDSGHTGVRLVWLEAFFLPLLAGSVLLIEHRTHPSVRLALVVATSGALLPPLLTQGRLLLPYEAWIEAGMPPPAAWRVPALVAYGAATALGIAVALWARPGGGGSRGVV